MDNYRFDVLSLFPESFSLLSNLGVIGRALNDGIADLHIHNPRHYTNDSYHKVDDEPYGGGVGMVLKPEPIYKAIENIPCKERRKILLMTPQGHTLSQNYFRRWASESDQLILICGQYEGFDERIRTLADEEISMGDFVLTGGELPAMAIINGVIRLLPGTLGKSESLEEESHSYGLLEHPHYTRPAVFRGMKVPDVLRSGDHQLISSWRRDKSLDRTKSRRPDLYKRWMNKTKCDMRKKVIDNSLMNESKGLKVFDDDHIWI